MLSKVEAARKLADLVIRLKHANSICPHEYELEIKQIESEIELIEFDLALTIDNIMASRYRVFNNKNSQLRNDPSKGLLGRWGGVSLRTRKGRGE